MRMSVLLLLLIGVITCTKVQAQTVEKKDSSQIYKILKKDSSVYYGKIIKDNGREILFETISDEKTCIPKSEIKRIAREQKNTKFDKFGNVDVSFKDSGVFSNRYYFWNSARPAKQKTQVMYNWYGPEIQFSITENFNLGAMATWNASPVALTGKYIFPKKWLGMDISVSSMLGTLGYLTTNNTFIAFNYFTLTKGNDIENFSFHLGHGFSKLNDVFTVGNRYRISSGMEREATEALILALDINQETGKLYQKDIQAAMFGFSTVLPTRKKALWMFDALFCRGKKYNIYYTYFDQEIKYIKWNRQLGQDVYIKETVSVGRGYLVKDKWFTNIILAPSIRWTKTKTKAFQASLPILIHISNSESVIVPIPTFQWMRTL